MPTFTWRPSRRGAGPGPPVTFDVNDADAAVLHAHWAEVRTRPPGPARTAAVQSLQTLLDLHALLGAVGAPTAAPHPDRVTDPRAARRALEAFLRLRDEAEASNLQVSKGAGECAVNFATP